MFRLLVVDDEEAVVDNLVLTMPWSSLQVNEVFKAYSSAEALDILNTHSIHIVITDIRMPGMSGLELVQHIAERWSKTKCLILSGYADFEYAQKALQSHTVDYLLKPISEKDLMKAVARVIIQIQQEWESISSFQRAQTALREHLPLLKCNLLSELLQGKRITTAALQEKLEMFSLSFSVGDAFSILLIRLEEEFYRHDFQSLSLLEYAIGNIASELCEGVFELWNCKDVNEHLVFCVKVKAEKQRELDKLPDGLQARQKLLEQFAVQIQENVKIYLKGGVSVVVAGWASFPEGIIRIYQDALTTIRKLLGKDREIIVVATERESERKLNLQSLTRLYEPPSLLHLLDAGRWDAVQEKLQAIFEELELMQESSSEHLMEIFLALASAITYIAHKNGHQLVELIGEDADPLLKLGHRIPTDLKSWALRVFERIRKTVEREIRDTRSVIVKRVHAIIEQKLSEDVSIQTIADHVFLHPVYLSRIYKLETGESIGNYLLKLRMEKAASLLKNGEGKIMEIASVLGYQNATYFSKVFKDYYGMTPHQFREDGMVL